MRVPYQDCFHLIEPLLAKVEKPSRYIDHEWGTLSKADADYRCCMIYPDVYEVGLPNQGIAILYNILNQAEGISCERGYVPWPDMGDAMREAGIPLLSLEGAAPVASFDIVGMHVPHEMAVTNFLEALDLAGIPLLAADRTEDDPIIVAGGPSVYNPEPYAAFFDAILIGEGEESLLEICQLHRRLRDEGATVVYTSHYMEEVEQICSRIMIMDGGKILALGTADELKRGIAVGEKIVIELPGAVEARGCAAAQTVGALPHVLSCEFANGELRAACEASERNLLDVLGALKSSRVAVGRVYSEPPTLNDVFLEITGRELRD